MRKIKKILAIPLAFGACLIMFVFTATFASGGTAPSTAIEVAGAPTIGGTATETASPVVTTSTPTTAAACAVLESEAAIAMTIDVKMVGGAAPTINGTFILANASRTSKDISTMAAYAVALGKIDTDTTDSAYSAMKTSLAAKAFVA